MIFLLSLIRFKNTIFVCIFLSYGQEEAKKPAALSSTTYVLSFDLPYYAKFFLIAAYLASYNPAKADRRLFVKNHVKEHKKRQQQRKQAGQLLGPKPFALDRLLAIFYAIVGEDVNLTANLLSQVKPHCWWQAGMNCCTCQCSICFCTDYNTQAL
jgi:hypothetical protein